MSDEDLAAKGGDERKLRKYWTTGEGAAKIRWGTPGSFDRCVRNLRKYFPADPEGLCANLHHEATGKWPNEGKGENGMDAEEFAAMEPVLPSTRTIRWRGLIAPDDARTGDRRAFAPGAIGHRKLPLPAEWVREKGRGHEGAVTVASIDAIYSDGDGMWGTGEILDPMFIPEVTPFVYLAGKRLVGPSVDLDPDLVYEIVPDPNDPSMGIKMITKGTVHGVTFVSTPAFSQVTLEIYDDEETGALLASAGVETFAVNSKSWRSWSIADKNTPWSVDAAIARLAAWSGGDTGKYAQAFLYYDKGARADVRETYRLPIADVINGKLVLIPRAVYSAAAFLSGAHGGVKTIPDDEVMPLQRVVTEIYAVLAETTQDPQLIPPWQRGGRQGARDAGAMSVQEEIVDEDLELVGFAVRSSGWSDMPVADRSRTWDKGAALRALNEWAGDDMAEYGRAFLWKRDGGGEQKGDFKFPVAMPIDGRLTIVPNAVNNADARLSSADIPSADKTRMQAVINSIQERFAEDDSEDESEDEGMALVAAYVDRPPAAWFAEPQMSGPMPVEVTADGRVAGLLAAWNTCHKGFHNKCVMPPRSATNYKHYKLGKVLTAEGRMVKIGRVTVGTGHADERFGVIPAREHYENTGKCAAVVNVGENQYGIWVAGALVAGCPEETAAELRRSPLSGDWRRVGGNLELVGALAVNDPGFEVIAEDEVGVYSLTAAGVLVREDCGCPGELAQDAPDADDRAAMLADVDSLLAGVDAAAKAALYERIMEGV